MHGWSYAWAIHRFVMPINTNSAASSSPPVAPLNLLRWRIRSFCQRLPQVIDPPSITHHYSKLTSAIPTKTTMARQVAITSMGTWVMTYQIPEFLLVNNGPQLVSKLFNSMCFHLQTKLLSTTAYHPQTNGQTGGHDNAIATQLPHHKKEHQDRDAFLQPLTYAYNSQVYRRTNMTPLSLTLTREPTSPADISLTAAIPGSAKKKITATITQTGASGTPQSKENKDLLERRYGVRKVQKIFRQIGLSWTGVHSRRSRLCRCPAGHNSKADEIAQKISKKLKSKKDGPLKLISRQSHTITLNEGGTQKYRLYWQSVLGQTQKQGRPNRTDVREQVGGASRAIKKPLASPRDEV